MGKIMFNGVDYSAPSTAGVTGVKGNAESSYRTGNVNITPANIGALATTGDASNTTTAFTQASTRANLTTKEKISVSFGKIMKWFADLKTVAFTGSYNDLSNKPTIPSAYTLPSATSTTLGGVKTTDSSAVTNSTGLALAATEKNASINGTLANQISTLNSNLNSKLKWTASKVTVTNTNVYTNFLTDENVANSQEIRFMVAIGNSAIAYDFTFPTYPDLVLTKYAALPNPQNNYCVARYNRWANDNKGGFGIDEIYHNGINITNGDTLTIRLYYR